MKLKRIPHPWWHWFFTRLDSCGLTTEGNFWVRDNCSKCNIIYQREEDRKDLEIKIVE